VFSHTSRASPSLIEKKICPPILSIHPHIIQRPLQAQKISLLGTAIPLSQSPIPRANISKTARTNNSKKSQKVRYPSQIQRELRSADVRPILLPKNNTPALKYPDIHILTHVQTHHPKMALSLHSSSSATSYYYSLII
jgi:hypothetical protein